MDKDWVDFFNNNSYQGKNGLRVIPVLKVMQRIENCCIDLNKQYSSNHYLVITANENDGSQVFMITKR